MTETMRYDVFAPPRISFGWGRRDEVGDLARPLGARAFVVHGSRTLADAGHVDAIGRRLVDAGIEVAPAGAAEGEPEVEHVDRLVARLRGEGAGPGDLVVAIGGGSAIDLAKAAAAMAPQPHGASVRDYLEGVGTGLRIEADPLPLLAMPTTSGTGSEATKNAVISSYEPAFKKSLRSDRMVPRVVLVDPELSVSVPADITAHTGMDAITQLVESFISRRSRPVPRALALQGIELSLPAIVRAVEDGTDREARTAMAHAALLSGIALANSGLGLAHGVAAALGVHCRVRHGLACAVMLPAALRVNQEVRRGDVARIGRRLTGETGMDDATAAAAAVEGIEDLCRRVGIPRSLSAIGVTPDRIDSIVTSSRGNSMSGNPRELSDAELSDLLRSML